MAKTLTTKALATDDYLALVRRFPLRPLRTAADYRAATAVLDGLAVRDEGSLAPDEQDYLDALTAFVEMYDDAHHPIEPPADPLDALRALMEHRQVTVTALGALFKSKGVASEILSGKRPLTLKRIEKLAAYFRVEPAIFVRPRPT